MSALRAITGPLGIIKVRCHYCSNFRNPSEIIHIGQGGVLMCFHCYEWHLENLKGVTEDGAPKGCFECRATWQELRLRIEPGDNTDVKMYLVPKDGIYQLLCRTCSDAYELKRADLLKGTLYGQSKGIV